MSWLVIMSVALLFSFALSGLETAVASVSRVRVRHAASEGDARARGLLPLLEDRDALLGAVTVLNHIANLTAFAIMAWKLVGLMGAWGYAAAVVVALPIFLIVLEVLPKKLFRRYPYRSIRALALLVHSAGLLRPIFRVLSRVSPIPVEVPEESAGRNDLHQQAATLEQQNQLAPGAARLIHRVLDYRRLRAADVMRPLNRSIALSSDLPLRTALIMAREHEVSALPVMGERGGFVGVLDFSALPGMSPPDRLVRQHMRNLDTVHAGDSALQTLQRLRKRGRGLCLVVDSAEQPAGIVHEEDLLRHLMGTRA